VRLISLILVRPHRTIFKKCNDSNNYLRLIGRVQPKLRIRCWISADPHEILRKHRKSLSWFDRLFFYIETELDAGRFVNDHKPYSHNRLVRQVLKHDLGRRDHFSHSTRLSCESMVFFAVNHVNLRFNYFERRIVVLFSSNGEFPRTNEICL